MQKELKIGDVCRVRQWEDMAKEFGEYEYGINIMPVFAPEMKYMCGKLFTIKKVIPPHGYQKIYISEEGIEAINDSGILWNITEEMLERVCDKEITILPHTNDEVQSLLFDKKQ